MGKKGTNLAPKIAAKKNKTPASSSKPTTSKLPTITPSTSSKALPPYSSGKSKSSSSFGIIWLPIKKRSKHKETVYNAYKYNDKNKERAPSMYNMMSGDSNHFNRPKMDEETIKDKGPVVLGGVAAATALEGDCNDTDDKSYVNTEEDKDAVNDPEVNRDGDHLVNDEKSKETIHDKVDSVPLKFPSVNKVRSIPSAQEDESCGMKCLYYTLQCCDCVLM